MTCFTTHRVFLQAICIITLLSFFPSSVQAWHLLPAADREALEPSARDVAARLGLRLLGEDRLSALDGVPGPGGAASALKLLGEEKLTRLAVRTDAESPGESDDTFAPVLAKTALKQTSRAAERYTRPDHSLADAAGAMGAPVTLRKPAIDLRAHFGAVPPADGLQLAKSYIVRKPTAAEPEPEDTAATRYAEAETLFASGDWAGAVLAALDAVDLDPASEGANSAERLLFDLGQAAKGGLWTFDAVSALSASLEARTAPEHIHGQYALATAHKLAGDACRKAGETEAATHAYLASQFVSAQALDALDGGPEVMDVIRVYVSATAPLGLDGSRALAKEMRALIGAPETDVFERYAFRAGVAALYDAHFDRVEGGLADLDLMCDFEDGHFDALLESAVVSDARKAEVLVSVGETLFSGTRWAEAADAFALAFQTAPDGERFTDRARYFHALSLYFASHSDPETGVKVFEELLASSPDGYYSDSALWMLARVYWGEEDYETAHALLSDLVAYYPLSKWRSEAVECLEKMEAGAVNGESQLARDGSEATDGASVDCGPLALNGLLSRLGVTSSVSELRSLAGTGPDGTAMEGLMKAAARKGVRLTGVSARDLEELRAPFIAFVEGNHFTLVTSYSDEAITLVGAGGAEEQTPRAAFEAGWSGAALVPEGMGHRAAVLTREARESLVGGLLNPENGDGEDCETNGNQDCGCPRLQPCDDDCDGVEGMDGNGDGADSTSEQWSLTATPGGGKHGSPGGDCVSPPPPGDGPPPPRDRKPGDPISVNPSKLSRLAGSGPGAGGYIDMLQLAQSVSATDVNVSVRGGLHLRFSRSYHNPWGSHRAYFSDLSVPYKTNIGENWAHNLNTHLRTTDNGNYVYYVSPSGNPLIFEYDSTSGGYSHFASPTPITTPSKLAMELKQSTTTDKFYLVFARGLTYEFSAPVQEDTENPYCRLEKISDGISNEIELEYDYSGAFTTFGRLTKVTPPGYGTQGGDTRFIEVNYGGTYDQITSVRLMDDTTELKKVEYSYTASVNPNMPDLAEIEVNDNDGKEVTYDYGYNVANGITMRHISKITDRKGNETQFSFTQSSLDWPSAEEIEVTYENGLKTVFTKENIATAFYETTVKNYNGTTALSKMFLAGAPNTDSGKVGYFDFYHGPSSSERDRWYYQYNGNAQLTSIQYAYDWYMNSIPYYDTWTEYTYNADGRLSTAGVSGNQASYHYASSGDLWPDYATDKHGVKTYFYYDGHGRQTRLAHPSTSASDPPGLSDGVTYEYDSYSQVTTVTSVLGNETHYVYDSRGNMVTKILPDDDPQSPDHPLVYEYDGLGAVITAYDALGNYTAYEYLDEGCGACGGTAGRSLGSVTDALGNTTSFEYDDNGNQITVTDALNRETAYDYDEMNRVTSVTYPGGAQATMEYNLLGRLTKQTGVDGTETTYEHDYYGRTTKVTDPVGDIEYAFDERGNLTTVTDGNGHETTYTYEGAHTLTQVADAEGNDTFYTYDKDRVVTTAAGASGTTDPVEYVYDPDTGQLSMVKYTNSTSGYGTDTVTYGYDLGGRLTQVDDWLGGAGNNDGHFFEYDEMSRLTTYRDFDDTQQDPKTLDYVYDDAGRVVTMTDYDGYSTTYTYTATHQVSTITAPGSKVWTFHYNALGQRTYYEHPNGIETHYGYDGQNRLTKLEHKDGSTVLEGWAYGLAADGNILRMARTVSGSAQAWDYAYDGRDRLTEAIRKNGAGHPQYRYVYTYDDGDNLLTKDKVVYEEVLADDFSDGDYTDDPTWTTSDSWTVDATGKYLTDTDTGTAVIESPVVEEDGELWFSYYCDEASPTSSDTLTVVPRYDTWWASANIQIAFGPSGATLKEEYVSLTTLDSNDAAETEAETWYDVYVRYIGDDIEVWWGKRGAGMERILSGTSTSGGGTTEGVQFQVASNAKYRIDDVYQVKTPDTVFTDDFSDGDYTDDPAWTIGTGTWSAASGYMRNSQATSGYPNFRQSLDFRDFRLSLSYYKEDTNDASFEVRDTSDDRLLVLLEDDQMRLRYHDGSSWNDLDTDVSADSDADTWYDIQLVCEGESVEVWWAEQGQTLTKVLESTTVVLDRDEMVFTSSPYSNVRFDDIALTALDSFSEDFSDNDYDGWNATASAWDASNGYMEPTHTTGIRQFYKDRPRDDGKLSFRYYRNDSSASSYLRVMARHTSSTRVDVRFYPGYARMYQWDGSSWSTLDTNMDVDTPTGSTGSDWYDVSIVTDGSHVEVWWRPPSGTWSRILSTDSATVLDGDYALFYLPDTASFSVDDIVFTAKETEQVIYEYNDANELTTSTQAGFETDYSYDDWGRMVTKEDDAHDYLATYKWRYGSKLKVAESNFPGEGDVGYMYDGLGKRRFRQTDVESANIDTWYRWDTKGHVLAEYENDASAFWDIGDMSMYLVPGSVLAQSRGSSPSTDAMHYHHDDGSGETAIMTDDDKNLCHRDTGTGDPEDGDGEDDESGNGEEPDSGDASDPEACPVSFGGGIYIETESGLLIPVHWDCMASCLGKVKNICGGDNPFDYFDYDCKRAPRPKKVYKLNPAKLGLCWASGVAACTAYCSKDCPTGDDNPCSHAPVPIKGEPGRCKCYSKLGKPLNVNCSDPGDGSAKGTGSPW